MAEVYRMHARLLHTRPTGLIDAPEYGPGFKKWAEGGGVFYSADWLNEPAESEGLAWLDQDEILEEERVDRRRLTQLAVASRPDGGVFVYGLDDRGTVWQYQYNLQRWYPLADLPDA